MSDNLNELMAMDPDQMTRDNIATLVAALRERRKQFKEDEASGKKGKGSKSKGKTSPQLSIDLSQISMDEI